MKHKTPKDYRALAQRRNFVWLGPEVANAHTKTSWECPQGHQWKATYNKIRQGRGCPYCSGKAPKTAEDYHSLAKSRGFRWLGTEVPDTHTSTLWECERGHQWTNNYGNIKRGSGCPYCSGKAQKTADEYRALAQERGFIWHGPEVPNTQTKTMWECEHGHTWEASYNKILQGKNCPYCAGKAPKTIDDYHEIAKERGFHWIGPEVADTHTNTTWGCEQGHTWQASYANVSRGSGCPMCIDLVNGAPVSEPQRQLCEMLDGVLNYPLGNYRIDVALFIDGVSIAIEYDSWFWHGHKQDNDMDREKELIAAGWRILRVKSNSLLPTHKQLDNAIECLIQGEKRLEIILDDWGKGPTRS